MESLNVPGTPHVLRDFVADLMEREGAVVEKIDPLGIDFIAPMALSQALGVPEEGRLGFGWELPQEAQRVSFESDWLQRLGKVLGQRGRRLRRRLNYAGPPPSLPERQAERALALHNAVFRLSRVTPAWTRYLLLTFRYAAVSDEKREGVVVLGFNLSNGSPLDDLLAPMLAEVSKLEAKADLVAEPDDLPPFLPAGHLGRLCSSGLSLRIRKRLAPFLFSLERRMERDLERVHEYHSDLRRESLNRMTRQPAETDREQLKLAAIRHEYQAKVADLQQKYALRIEAEWVQTLELILPVQRFELVLLRRKGERRFHLDWNPMARRLESPLCEATFTAESGRMICDDALHLVSRPALGPCPHCSKPYCRACNPLKCPKCHFSAQAD